MYVKENKALFTKLYPFVSRDLKLHGLSKETFCVIFNFWIIAYENPVIAPLSVIQEITGASQPSAVHAIQKLEKKGLITAEKEEGKPTRYTVTMPSEILEEFKRLYSFRAVKSHNRQGLSHFTGTGSVSLQQNKKNERSTSNSTLRVRKPEEMRNGGLHEVE